MTDSHGCLYPSSRFPHRSGANSSSTASPFTHTYTYTPRGRATHLVADEQFASPVCLGHVVDGQAQVVVAVFEEQDVRLVNQTTPELALHLHHLLQGERKRGREGGREGGVSSVTVTVPYVNQLVQKPLVLMFVSHFCARFSQHVHRRSV